jgi:TolB-like protein/tetratricopeptide (TPR) repeat protein
MRPSAPVRSIAVLPFEDLSGDSSQDYLAQGVTQGVTRELARIPKLRVISHAAVLPYRNAAKPRSHIADELNVDAWAEGSVARSGSRARITARVVQARTLRQLGSRSWERGVDDLPVLQKEVARYIADGVGAEWPAGRAPSGEIGRVNAEAYDSYLRGRFYSLRQTPDDNQAAIVRLERAVALAPDFASAYAELAQAYVWRLFLFAPSERSWEEKAFVAAEKALSIDPELPAAHLARGRLQWTPANHFPHEKAILEYRRALAADPSLDEARNQLAVIYCHMGLFDEALEEAKEAARTNPNNTLATYRTAQTLAFRGQYPEALSVLRSIPETTNPTMVGYQTAWVLFNLGRREEAAAKIAGLLRDHPDGGGLFTSMRAVLAASAGDRGAMEANIKAAVEKGKGFGHFHHTAYQIAVAYALGRRPEKAVEWLEDTAAGGFPCYPLFEKDHNLDNIRQDARFLEFMRKLKEQWLGYKALL